jgi:hypothetical protein
VETTADHIAALPGLANELPEQRNTPMNITSNFATPNDGPTHPASIEDLDLTPAGLADAPANEQDRESIVHTGNS